jgi:CubicO group peptidase (beta-lactamase class C family)
MTLRRSLPAWLSPLAAFCAMAAAQTACAQAAGAASASLTDPAEIESWMDQTVTRQIKDSHIPGAVVCVVKDGKIVFSKGYGWADLDAHRAVDAHKTLFRIASVTKTFTATAIMQQIERGNLRLDSDVRAIVDFPLPLTSSKPLTVADLLTHRGGFENGLFGVLSNQMTAMPSLKEVLSRTMPTQVRDPGTLSAYSNHGFTLLAYVVERKAGMPMPRYLQDNIFAPLAMQSTSSMQPLPEPLRGQVATGYSYADGRLTAHPFEIVLAAGGGAISSSGDDIGRFMIAQLQLGTLDGHRILSTESARDMQQVHFRYVPGPGGMGYGFPHAEINGHDVIWHTGALYYCYSRLVLIPDSGVGFFVAGNSDMAYELEENLFVAFMDRYFPQSSVATVASPAEPAAYRAVRAEEIAGYYHLTGEPVTTFAALRSLANMAKVTRTDRGISILRNGKLIDYQKVANEHYRTTDADAARLGDVVFFGDASGQVAGYAVQNRETSSMERVGNPLRTPPVAFWLVRIVCLVALLGLIAAAALAFRWRRHATFIRWSIALVALSSLGGWAVVLMLPWLTQLVSDEMDWVPWRLTLFLSGTSAVAILSAVAALVTLRTATLGSVPRTWRAAALIWSAAALTGTWLIIYWHLFGYQYY